MTYWLGLFTHANWQTFLSQGARTVGFRKRRWASVQKINPGDYLLCYLTGLSRFIGALTVVDEPYLDDTPLWPEDLFSARLQTKPVILLTAETGVPILEMRDTLSIFENLSHDNAWTAKLRQSPTRWSRRDGEAVMEALLEAQVQPVVREIDKRRLKYRAAPFRAKTQFIVADADETIDPVNISGFREPISHTEMQWLLLKLGNDLDLSVWVARNDRSRGYAGFRFADLPKLLARLPRQFDPATQKIIEHIDVLWLQNSAIVAAFEIESTSAVYSGLLRMADLVTMQPNLNIPLYVVAPERRKNKVLSEINRPTFCRLLPPLPQICRYIGFSRLRAKLQEVAPAMRYLRPEFIAEIAEPCALERD